MELASWLFLLFWFSVSSRVSLKEPFQVRPPFAVFAYAANISSPLPRYQTPLSLGCVVQHLAHALPSVPQVPQRILLVRALLGAKNAPFLHALTRWANLFLFCFFETHYRSMTYNCKQTLLFFPTVYPSCFLVFFRSLCVFVCGLCSIVFLFAVIQTLCTTTSVLIPRLDQTSSCQSTRLRKSRTKLLFELLDHRGGN